MQGRTALAASLVCGALAVAIVAVDLQFGLQAEIQALEDGVWVPTNQNEEFGIRGHGLGCVGQELRLQVDNDRLVGTTAHVSISYWNAKGSTIVVLDEQWEMTKGEVRHHEFSIPSEAFQGNDNQTAHEPRIDGEIVNLNVQVNEIYLGTCVKQTEAAQ